MDCYKDFAYIYDKLIDQDYNKWVSYIEQIFERYNTKPKLILDLACGTGNMSCLMAKKGYDMIGVDNSEDMLSVAKDKSIKQKLDIMFLCQSMTEFELYGTVDAVICTLDAVNYLLTLKDLNKTFKLIKNYLNPNGLFIFDINTSHKLKNVLGNNTFIYDTKNIFYTWENELNPKTFISSQYFTFFVKENGAYYRIDETHRQRAFSYEEIEGSLNNSGLKSLDKFDLFTFDNPEQNSEKVVFVAKCFC